MSNKKIKVDDLTNVITAFLKEFEDVTEEAADKGLNETAKTALKQLQNAHPAGSGKYGSWDAYNKDWTVMKRKRDKKAIIHNKNHYQLTHLLEKGHALRGGGKTAAFTHIAPVADKCDNELLKNIKKFI